MCVWRGGEELPCGLCDPVYLSRPWGLCRNWHCPLRNMMCWSECLSVTPRRGHVWTCAHECALLGLCVHWLSSLLVTLRPGTPGALPSPPQLTSNFSTPSPSILAHWLLEECYGNEVRGTKSCPRVSAHSGVRKGQQEGPSFAHGNGMSWLLSSASSSHRPGSNPRVFVDLHICWEIAGCQVAGQGLWASLAAPGMAQNPSSRWGVVESGEAQVGRAL